MIMANPVHFENALPSIDGNPKGPTCGGLLVGPDICLSKPHCSFGYRSTILAAIPYLPVFVAIGWPLYGLEGAGAQIDI